MKLNYNVGTRYTRLLKYISQLNSSIDDPLKKNATIGFINNFGQIPKQLFKKAHPSKKMSQRSSTILDPNNIIPSQGIIPPEKLFFHNLENLRPSLQPVKGMLEVVSLFSFYDLCYTVLWFMVIYYLSNGRTPPGFICII